MKSLRFQFFVSFYILFLFHASAAVRYVNVKNTSPASPYTSWATAATNIQNAVDASMDGDLILVTNGVYQSAGRAAPDGSPTSVVVTHEVVMHSVNGATVTLIDGGGTNRCVYLTNGTTLVGFTLTNGAAGLGGGVFCASVSVLVASTNALVANCLLINNSASSGGGASSSTLSNCIFTGNSADGGGGAAFSILNNCVLTNNLSSSATALYYCMATNCVLTGNSGAYCSIESTLANCLSSGNNVYDEVSAGDTLINCTVVSNMNGIVDSVAINCIIYGNDAQGGANYTSLGELGPLVLDNCCTTPDPGGFDGSVGNITNEPTFANPVSGDFHFQSNSPCINAGNNAYVTNTNDLGGNPRIVGGTVDIGAYEYQTPTSVISYAWLQQYALPTDGSADYTDTDGDGMNNYQEWIVGTDPTNPLSALKMLSPMATNSPAGLLVSWVSVNTRVYYLQSSTNLEARPAFSTIQSNIVGQTGTTTYTDTTASNRGPYFYRVGVQ